MARVRTFIALDPGGEIRSRLVNVQHKLGREVSDVKWVEENNLHLTLLFLGEVRDRDLPNVCRAVAKTAEAIAPFSIEIAGVGCFPNPRRPRIVWAGIQGGVADVVALHDALEEPLDRLGCYRREERQFTPHLTLGRSKSDEPSDQLARVLPQYQSWRGGDGLIREVLVMSSELTSKGPQYTVLARGKFLG